MSALAHPTRRSTGRAVPVAAVNRSANPPYRCLHRRGVVLPAVRSAHLRDRFPGHLGVATGTADKRAERAAGPALGRRIGSCRSLPSILSVGYDRQPAGRPTVLPALRQSSVVSSPSVRAGSLPEVDLPPLSRCRHRDEMTCQLRRRAGVERPSMV